MKANLVQSMVQWFANHHPLRRALLALALGSITVLGFAPVSIPLATLLAMVAMWGLWSTASSGKQAALEGFAFGFGLFGYGINWLGISLSIYGGVPFGVAWLMVLIFVVTLAGFVALLGVLAHFSYRVLPQSAWAVLALPVLWVFIEWLRTVLWSGFPWLLVGYSHTDTWLLGWAPILGTLGVSLVVAISAGLLWLLVRTQQWMPIAISFGLLWAASGYLSHHTWVTPEGEAKPIAVVHGHLSETQRWQEEELLPTIRLYQRESEPFIGKVDAIIWPETAIPTFLHRVMPALAQFRDQASAQGTQVVVGAATKQEDLSGVHYYNSLLSLDGQFHYDKQHLVPFSEFYPAFSLLSAVADYIGMPMAQFSVGQQTPVQTLANQSVGVAICYEADFGHEMAQHTAATDWWLVVSDDGWFYPSHMAAQHWQMTRLRAVELGREIVRVTNQGYTGVVGVDATQRIAALPSDALAAKLVDVQAYRGETPFVRFGHLPLILLFSFTFAWIGMSWRRHYRTS